MRPVLLCVLIQGIFYAVIKESQAIFPRQIVYLILPESSIPVNGVFSDFD